MTISFDLDDTLIPGTKRFATEPQKLLHRFCGTEPIRAGTIRLMKQLKAEGHRIIIYTTSLRSPRKIWWQFFLHGIIVHRIINQYIHERTLKEDRNKYSKYPPAFDIDIHIDDSEGVAIEGSRHNFRTIIITEDNPDWVTDVSDIISRLCARNPE